MLSQANAVHAPVNMIRMGILLHVRLYFKCLYLLDQVSRLLRCTWRPIFTIVIGGSYGQPRAARPASNAVRIRHLSRRTEEAYTYWKSASFSFTTSSIGYSWAPITSRNSSPVLPPNSTSRPRHKTRCSTGCCSFTEASAIIRCTAGCLKAQDNLLGQQRKHYFFKTDVVHECATHFENGRQDK